MINKLFLSILLGAAITGGSLSLPTEDIPQPQQEQEKSPAQISAISHQPPASDLVPSSTVAVPSDEVVNPINPVNPEVVSAEEKSSDLETAPLLWYGGGGYYRRPYYGGYGGGWGRGWGGYYGGYGRGWGGYGRGYGGWGGRYWG